MNTTPSITRRDLLAGVGGVAAVGALTGLGQAAHASDHRLPNFVVVFTDDLGYGDLSCYGSPLIHTPSIDGMARRGMRFTDCYTAPVCTPARAALLTGCYAPRVNLPRVLFPDDANGLADQETTIAEYLKGAGYATAWIGKWHLGIRPEHSPLEHGFDRFFGLPYSNDMTPPTWPPLPLYDDRTVIEEDPDQSSLTRRYTGQTVAFLREHADEPFFVCLAHTQPHEPLASEFAGTSAAGPHGDSVEEIDYYVGVLLDELTALGVRDDTCVIFTSDNGPWYVGNAGDLYGRKSETYEGGVRVPLVVEWPAVTPAGVTYREPVSLIDLLPTFCAAAGVTLNPDRIIDGHNMLPALSTGQPADRGDVFYYDASQACNAVRRGEWKLHVRRLAGPGFTGRQFDTTAEMPQLFNLRHDPEESYNLAAHYPDVVAELTERIDSFDAALRADRASHYGG